LISGVDILCRRARRFLQFIAVPNSLLFRIGTVIGLVTLIVLAPKPIRALYKA